MTSNVWKRHSCVMVLGIVEMVRMKKAVIITTTTVISTMEAVTKYVLKLKMVQPANVNRVTNCLESLPVLVTFTLLIKKITKTDLFFYQILMSVSLQVPVLNCVQILKETTPVPVPKVIFRVNLTLIPARFPKGRCS